MGYHASHIHPSQTQPMIKRLIPSSRLQQFLWWCAALLLITSPLWVAWGIFQREDISLQELFPLYSDEIYYWHQAATFARVGFSNGQYSVGEISAQIGRYHAWGLAAPVLYGSIGHFTGWPLWAIPAVNLALMSLALLVWVAVSKPHLKQLFAALILIVTFAPFLTLLSSSMFEVVQFSWAIVLASILAPLLEPSPRQHPARWAVAALSLVCLVAVFRVTWCVIIPITGVLALRHRGWRGLILGGVLGVGLAGLMYIVYTRTAAPYSEYVPHFKAFSDGLQNGIQAVTSHISVNIDLFLHGERIEMGLRAQVLIIWGLMMFAALVRVLIPRLRPRIAPYDWGEVLFHTFLLMGQLFLIIVVYDVGSWRDYRLLSSHVLLSAFLLIARRRWGVLTVVILLSLLILPSAMDTTHEWTQEYVKQYDVLTKLDEWTPQIDALIQYDPAGAPWCNAVTHTVYFAFVPTYTLLAIDPGMGLTILLSDADVRLPFKARYLLLDNDFVSRHAAELNAAMILSVPGGGLYLNHDAAC